jgi:hypothetical protein
MTVVDLDALTADQLWHLAAVARERERQERERALARAADVMDRPTLGYYRRKLQQDRAR